MRYYFDMREGDEIAPDEEGMEVQEEAAHTLADMARDTVRQYHDRNAHRMSVEVRDDDGPVLDSIAFKNSAQAKRVIY
jgi:hypothetical protein